MRRRNRDCGRRRFHGEEVSYRRRSTSQFTRDAAGKGGERRWTKRKRRAICGSWTEDLVAGHLICATSAAPSWALIRPFENSSYSLPTARGDDRPYSGPVLLAPPCRHQQKPATRCTLRFLCVGIITGWFHI